MAREAKAVPPETALIGLLPPDLFAIGMAQLRQGTRSEMDELAIRKALEIAGVPPEGGAA
jgi:hypothetical protein